MVPGDLLDFWLLRDRKDWFRKDPALDEEIRGRFLPTYEQAVTGALSHWEGDPRGCLALIILLDQFPRNMFRGDARAFAADATALATSLRIIERGWDRQMTPTERMFVYLPLEHSERLADQERCLALMKEIAVFPETTDLHQWAEAHLKIIRRFGRFPHRNAALGRQNTPEEAEFLSGPNSGF